MTDIGASLNAVFRRAADAGILPKTIDGLLADPEGYHAKILDGQLSDFVARQARFDANRRRAKRFRNTGKRATKNIQPNPWKR